MSNSKVRSIAYTGENTDADELRIIAIKRGVRLGDVVRCACDLALGKPVQVNFFESPDTFSEHNSHNVSHMEPA